MLSIKNAKKKQKLISTSTWETTTMNTNTPPFIFQDTNKTSFFISLKTKNMKKTHFSDLLSKVKTGKKTFFFFFFCPPQIPPTSTSNSKTSKSSLIPGKLNCGVLSVRASQLYLKCNSVWSTQICKGGACYGWHYLKAAEKKRERETEREVGERGHLCSWNTSLTEVASAAYPTIK